jgi:hypothetical protein
MHYVRLNFGLIRWESRAEAPHWVLRFAYYTVLVHLTGLRDVRDCRGGQFFDHFFAPRSIIHRNSAFWR